MTQRKSLDLLLVREQDLGGVRSGQLQAVMFFFLKSDWLGFSLKGLLCILQKGFKWNGHLADGALCICISALSTSCSLSLSPPVLLQSLWVSLGRAVHAGKQCGVLCLGWSAEERRGHGCVAALGPCCLPSLLGAFRSFRVCSAGYCRFIKPQWLKHNARQERGHGWTWTSPPAKQPLANQEALIRQLANSNHPSCCLPLPAYLSLPSYTDTNTVIDILRYCLFFSHIIL